MSMYLTLMWRLIERTAKAEAPRRHGNTSKWQMCSEAHRPRCPCGHVREVRLPGPVGSRHKLTGQQHPERIVEPSTLHQLSRSSYDPSPDMEEPNNDIDTETLQAQIDLSMAYAQNLIASWLPTSGPMSQSSSRAAEAEAELQAILRRPPRWVYLFPSPDLTRRLFELFSSLFFSLFFWALGWALEHPSLKLLHLRRHVSCKSSKAAKSAPGKWRTGRRPHWSIMMNNGRKETARKSPGRRA
jgi:hypothetical protein